MIPSIKKNLVIVLPHLHNGGAEASTVILLKYLSAHYHIALYLLKDSGPLIGSVPSECDVYYPKKASLLCRIKQLSVLIWRLRGSDAPIISRVWFANIFVLLFKPRHAVIFEDSVPSALAKMVKFGGIKLCAIKYLYRHAKTIVCVSQLVEDDLISLGIPSDLLVQIPNPVPPPRIESRRGLVENRLMEIAYVGSLKGFKGWACLTKCLNSLSFDTARQCRFHVVGNNRSVLPDLSIFVSRGGKIVQHGVMQNSEIPYELFDVVVIPSTVQESFCNVFHEALMNGCFIIATNLAVPYPISIFADYGIIFTEPSAEALIGAFQKIFTSPNLISNAEANPNHPILSSTAPGIVLDKLIQAIEN